MHVRLRPESGVCVCLCSTSGHLCVFIAFQPSANRWNQSCRARTAKLILLGSLTLHRKSLPSAIFGKTLGRFCRQRRTQYRQMQEPEGRAKNILHHMMTLKGDEVNGWSILAWRVNVDVNGVVNILHDLGTCTRGRLQPAFVSHGDNDRDSCHYRRGEFLRLSWAKPLSKESLKEVMKKGLWTRQRSIDPPYLIAESMRLATAQQYNRRTLVAFGKPAPMPFEEVQATVNPQHWVTVDMRETTDHEMQEAMTCCDSIFPPHPAFV